MKQIGRLFESILWNSRYLVVIAVVASLLASIILILLTTADLPHLALKALAHADPALDSEARHALQKEVVADIVRMLDTYLLATAVLIFALGLYELFINDIAEARDGAHAHRLLQIKSLDDLKERLGKVILVILIVSIFEQFIQIKVESALDLLLMAASVLLVAAALYLSHGPQDRSAGHGDGKD